MKKHQPALLKKYMPHRHHSVGLRSMVRHDSGAGFGDSTDWPRIKTSSPSLTDGCSSGLSRNQAEKATTQTTPTTPNATNAPRQPNHSANSPMSSGATAPPQRPNIHSNPWARPRCLYGNQFRRARALLGYAPASPAPKRNRMSSNSRKPLNNTGTSTPEGDHEKPPPSQVQSTHSNVTRWPLSRVNDQTQPVRAVNSDHHRTIRPSTLRGPNRSPSQPLGTSNSAYDR